MNAKPAKPRRRKTWKKRSENCRKKRVPLLVVKNRKGAVAQKGQTVKTPRKRIDPVDSVGAGDSFDAGFLHEYVRGADIRKLCTGSGTLPAGRSVLPTSGGTEVFREKYHQ